MYHLDRRKTVRGQAVAALYAVLPAAVILAAAAGGGAGTGYTAAGQIFLTHFTSSS